MLGVKLITLPLNWQQLSGAARMKSIKPVQERVQLWYGDNDQMKNAAVGNLCANPSPRVRDRVSANPDPDLDLC